MKVRIKDWDDAVKAALADDGDWYVENDSIFGIGRECGDCGIVVEGDEKGRCFRTPGFAYPMCIVDKLQDYEPNPDDVLRYGTVITDDQLHTINNEVYRRPVTGDVRIRLIEFDGLLFYHKMANGDVVDCRCVGRVDA